ncbi:hypothetical protein [Aquimarina muelleri]|uniref:Uncharacterized protein n=1 Tax=Aquimarina muelleri TaxID=279356 RepID=A0A918JVP0_9FLAO|nr:hypothetical protein [Aquimarina muelleri]MCX2764406.1 hypothetical protein [Aquimarina muelleri]GGX21623.1 hypothetical protein GCM10007384_23610 [Aquimarina muelleri]
MKKFIFLLLINIIHISSYSQIDADSVIGLPTATDLTQINAIASPQIGSVVFNLGDQEIYRYTSTGWQRATDDQNASEVNIVTPTDLDGDAINETTVEGMIQSIAPITSKAARIFYPPSIAIDASTIGTGRTVDLYNEYITQFGTPTAASTGAPAVIPTYTRTELYYYVTFADPTVFNNISIAANGVMTYDIIATPATYNSLINVVFVVQ